ncbi:MAG: hypothetical protein R3E96_08410 [Planctomycetota bacterium]
MTELLVAAFGTLGVMQYTRYLRTGDASKAITYGLCTLAAVFTKGSGLAMIAVALLAPLLAGRPGRWITRGTLGAGAIVGVFGFAWYFVTMKFSQSTWAGNSGGSIPYWQAAAAFYGRDLLTELGSVLIALAAIGQVFLFTHENFRDLGATSLAWLLGLTACALFLPTGIEARHLVPAMPVILVLAGVGALEVWRVMGFFPSQRVLPAAAILSLGVVLQAFALRGRSTPDSARRWAMHSNPRLAARPVVGGFGRPGRRVAGQRSEPATSRAGGHPGAAGFEGFGFGFLGR